MGEVAVYVRNDVGGCRHCRCKEDGIKIKLAYQWVSVVVVTFDTDGYGGGGVKTQRSQARWTISNIVAAQTPQLLSRLLSITHLRLISCQYRVPTDKVSIVSLGQNDYSLLFLFFYPSA